VERNVRLLGFGVGIRALGLSFYSPFFALFLFHGLHLGYLEIGTLLAVVGLVQLPFSFAGGLVADRYARRSVIVFGLLGEGAATIGLAEAMMARSLPGCIAFALVGGALANVAYAALAAYTADLVEGSERTVGFTWQRIGYNAGFAVGVAVGGVLVGLLGFPGATITAALVLLVGGTVLLTWLAPSPRDLRPRLLVHALPESRSRAPGPGLRASLHTLRTDRGFLEVTLALTLAGIVAFQWGVTFPLFVHDRLGVSYAQLGLGLALNGVIVVVAQAPMTRAVLGWRHTSLAIYGVGLYALAFVGLGFAGEWAIAPFAAFLLAVVVLTLGENLQSIPASVLPSNLAPMNERGSYNGAFNALTSLGGAIALSFGGWALGAIANPLLLWVVLAAPGIPAILLLRHAARAMPDRVDRA
jgi:MFS family permease